MFITKLLNFHHQYCTWTATIKQDLGESSPNRPTFTLVMIKIYQKVRTFVYDCSRTYGICEKSVTHYICFAWGSISLDTSSFIWRNSFKFRSNRSCQALLWYLVTPLNGLKHHVDVPGYTKFPKTWTALIFFFWCFPARHHFFSEISMTLVPK